MLQGYSLWALIQQRTVPRVKASCIGLSFRGTREVAVGQSCCGWKLLWDRFGIGGRDVAAGVEAGLTIPRYSVQILKSEATQDYRTESALFFFFFVSRVIRDESHCRLVKRVCESERE